MTENKRFEYDKDTCCFIDNNDFNIKAKSIEEIETLLNALHEENEHYKALFFELVETALSDKNCRELYCKGILDIFDKANSLNQARDMIKGRLR